MMEKIPQYETLGYSKEAVIRDFWNDGEDKIVYLKKR